MITGTFGRAAFGRFGSISSPLIPAMLMSERDLQDQRGWGWALSRTWGTEAANSMTKRSESRGGMFSEASRRRARRRPQGCRCSIFLPPWFSLRRHGARQCNDELSK